MQKVQEEFGIAETKFVPHLTIARSRVPSKQQYLLLKKRLLQMDFDLEFPVKSIYLFESIPSGKKPVYKKLAKFKLL